MEARVHSDKKIKRGTVRADGFIFDKYRQEKTGRIQEVWLSPEVFEKCRIKNNQRSLERIKDPAKRAELNALSLSCNQRRHRADYRHVMLAAAKHKAKKKGLPFDLETYSDIPYAEKCPIFKIPFRIGKGNWDSPTLDRIIPGMGYVKGNLIVVSRLANTIKTNASPDQILAVGGFYKKLFKKLGLRP